MTVEHETRFIRHIFDEFLYGKGTKEIARDLNQKLETEKYTAGHIFITLQNEKYKGDVRFLLTINQNPLTKKTVKNVGQAPQYYVKNSHPAIVSEEVWELANLALARQREFCSEHYLPKYHHREDQTMSLPLTGRIMCGTCGHTFKIKTSNRLEEKGLRYYGCIQHRTGYR